MIGTSDKIVVLGYSSGCKYCDLAKGLLNAMKLPYVFMEVSGDLRNFVKACGLTTVPAIFINGHLIGGYTQLHEYLGGQA